MTAEQADDTGPTVTIRSAPNQPAPDQPPPDQPAPDQPMPDQPMPVRPAPDQPAPEIAGAARMAANGVVAPLGTRAGTGDEQAWGALVDGDAPRICSSSRNRRLRAAD